MVGRDRSQGAVHDAADGRHLPLGLHVLSLKPPEWRTAAWLAALLAAGLLLLFSRPAAAPVRDMPSSAAAVPRAPGAAAAGCAAGGPLGAGALCGAGQSASDVPDPLLAEEAVLDRRLEQVLGRVAGVGAVTVRVRLAGGPVTHYAVDTQSAQSSTTQPGATGLPADVQRSSSNQVVLSGGGTPAVQGVRAAQVAGVLVVAAGASNPVVSEEIMQAVEAATGAPAYRIVVLPAASGGTGT